MPFIYLHNKDGGIRGWVIVDYEDFVSLVDYRWSDHKGYAFRSTTKGGRQVGIFMHREIMKPGPGLLVDHINGNTKDNRRANLRICTASQNRCNADRYPSRSGLKGAHYIAKNGRWEARITAYGQCHYLGRHRTKEAAHAAYVEAAKRLHGEFANSGKAATAAAGV